MITLVLGTGRSGTTLVTEMLAAHPQMNPTKEVEDRQFFKRPVDHPYPENYMTKLTIDWWTIDELVKWMRERKDIKVLWTMRDPRDICLSKIRRGQPFSIGGDGSDQLADDATEEGLVEDLERTQEAFEALAEDPSLYKDVLLVKMENTITSAEKECKRWCKHLALEYSPEMLEGPAHMRDKYKMTRYKGKIQVSQLCLWKRLYSIYDGFFKTFDSDMLRRVLTSNIVENMIEFYDYEGDVRGDLFRRPRE